MRIVVFGSGGVGGYFGGRLAQAGVDVWFIARGAHFAAIRDHGLRVSGVAGEFVIDPARVTDDPSSIEAVDAVLLGVKAWQVTEAAAAMRPLIRPTTFVVPLQNGIDAPEQLAEVLGPSHVLGGLCRVLAYVVEPGHIRYAGVAPYIAFGELNRSPSRRAEALQKAFSLSSGVTAEIPPDIRGAMWSKFLFIAALSGVGALFREPVGVIRSEPESRRLLRQALEEIYAVSLASRIGLPADSVERTLGFIDSLPTDATASMQRDIMQGRPSELESQVGTVVRLGERLGVEVPVHRMIYAKLLPLERKARGELEVQDSSGAPPARAT